MSIRTTACKSCGAAIFWRHTASGKHMPLDAVPLDRWAKGCYVLDRGLLCKPAHPLIDQGLVLYMNHWATCPHAKGWKQPKEEKPATPAGQRTIPFLVTVKGGKR